MTLILLFDESQAAAQAVFFCKAATTVYAFIPIPFLYFFSVFPKEDDVPRTYQLIAWFVLAVFFALISFSDLIIKDVVSVNGRFTFVAGPAYMLFVVYCLGFLINAFYRLIEKYYAYKGLERRQIVYVFLGFFLGFIFPVVSNLILPLFGYSLLTTVGPFSTVITVAFISYAITKSHLMDISVVISRAVAEVLTIIFLGSIYLGLVALYQNYFSNAIGLIFLIGSVIYGIIVGHFYQGLRLFFQTSSDKLFLRGKYDYYQELSAASARVGQKLSLAPILNILYETFRDVIEVSTPRIFLPENFADPHLISKDYMVYDQGSLLPQKDGAKISEDDPLIEKLIASRQPIMIENELFIPCLVETRLVAFFVLGKKLSEESYTDEDLKLLEVLANQAAITLDHTRSYEKIAADLEIAERQLSRSQRLASMGTLIAGVTHEIRNPLTVIRSETERLANQERDLAFLTQHRELLLKHIDRITGIVQRMLTMAKDKPKRHIKVDLVDILDSSLELVKLDGIEVKKQLDKVPLIKGDPVEIEEVFVNLIQNAAAAMAGKGTLTLSTFVENQRAVVEIADTGKGIPAELRERIFDPFFSTSHEGVGLGLSIVYRIVREHGGDIMVASEEGKGATFKILF